VRPAPTRLGLAGLVAAACSRTPVPAGAGQAPGSAVPESSASAAAPRAAATPVLPDGCWSGLSADVDAAAPPVAWLEALALRCASGLSALDPQPVLLEVGAGAPQRHEFEVKSGSGCVRVLASAGPPTGDLELELQDARGKSRHKDQLRARFALAPTFGTVCLEPGKYAAVVSVPEGRASVALRAYAAE
jgi:hypothetical protein